MTEAQRTMLTDLQARYPEGSAEAITIADTIYVLDNVGELERGERVRICVTPEGSSERIVDLCGASGMTEEEMTASDQDRLTSFFDELAALDVSKEHGVRIVCT